MSGRAPTVRATRCVCGEHTHPSLHERADCWTLQQRERLGEIRHLRRQTVWPLRVNGMVIGTWRSDFDFDERQPDGSWLFVVQDSKGYATREYKRTRKLIKAIYGFEIRET